MLRMPSPRIWQAGLVAILASCSAPTSTVQTPRTMPVPAPTIPAAAPPTIPATAPSATPAPATAITAPPAPREFRAAWVASVTNIDWPSRKDLSSAQQQAEIISIVERAHQLGLNALVLQVRTSADALYDSPLEPWSEYLTGTQGRAPNPYYDPLKMWVDEAHKRGIELHAWFNPYRARHTMATSANAPSHVANSLPHAVKSYGGFLWMDPGEDAASAHTLRVILDVVRRYDIDGVHIDDYFYPYPVPDPVAKSQAAAEQAARAAQLANASQASALPAPIVAELPFPDEPSWRAYLNAGGKLTRADWRRENVDRLIEKIYRGIKAEKRWVKFGISPFGIGRPDRRPNGIAGFSQYDKLYADAERWLNLGWCDYFTPQLYWPIDQAAQSFPVLLDYWAKENTQKRHLWPGYYTSRINATAQTWQPAEIANQIHLTRARGAADPSVRGHVHFSMVALLQNRRGLYDQLKATFYQEAALVPASPWLGNSTPRAPAVDVAAATGGGLVLKLRGDAEVARFAVWARFGNSWQFQVVSAAAGEIIVPPSRTARAANAVVVSAVDRLGNESARISVDTRFAGGEVAR